MEIRLIQRFTCPKLGSTPEENEDAFDCDEAAGRFAIADGATEGIFSRDWAQLLAQMWIRRQRTGWARAEMKTRTEGRQLAWYQVSKAQRGAFAALLGIHVDRKSGGWLAKALGDCVLFQRRRNRTELSFPVESAQELEARPILISTTAKGETWKTKTGTLHVGDRLVMATDALAAALLNGDPILWEALESPDLDQAIQDARQASRLKNDDTTVLVIEALE